MIIFICKEISYNEDIQKRKGAECVIEQGLYRETWMEVDLKAVTDNIKKIKSILPDKTKWMAVIKADAYGHGSVEIAESAIKLGASYLAVALLEEAIVLREAGINIPILVFGRVPAKHAIIAAKRNITLTFFQKEWIEEVQEIGEVENLKLHMKWDTGMGRVGVRTEEELSAILQELKKHDQLHLTGVYTHFATADEANKSYFNRQQDQFESLLHLFKSKWENHESVMVHTGNSAATIQYPNEMYDCVRLGIAMYGIYSSQVVKDQNIVDLKQAFSLHSRLMHVKKIKKDEAIGYGAEYKARQDEWIGTIAIGYGDGWMRSLKSASVLVDGKRYPIVGRISMDQLTISLDKEYPIGTKVTLIGKQGREEVTVEEIAKQLGTISYEVPCMISNRIPRIYQR